MLSIVIQQNAKVLYIFLIYGFQASQASTRAYSSFGVAWGVLLGSTGPRTYVYGGWGIVEEKTSVTDESQPPIVVGFLVRSESGEKGIGWLSGGGGNVRTSIHCPTGILCTAR